MQYKIVKLNTARNSLRCIIKTYKIKEIYIPYYICYAIRNAAYQEKCKIIYYHIDKNFTPIDEFPIDAYILYPNYFGICSHIVDKLVKKYHNVIIDNAHSFYSEPRGLASFNSLRKFFPTLRDGSFFPSSAKPNIIRQRIIAIGTKNPTDTKVKNAASIRQSGFGTLSDKTIKEISGHKIAINIVSNIALISPICFAALFFSVSLSLP